MKDLQESLEIPIVSALLIPEVSSVILSRLPEMPGGDDLSFSDYRREQVKEEMAAIKQATLIHKAYNNRNKAKARAKSRAAQRWAEGR